MFKETQGVAGQPTALQKSHYVRVEPPGTAGAKIETAGPRAAARVRKVAVIVTHGMGNQVPFETLQMVADRLLQFAPAPQAGQLPVKVGLVELNGTQLSRAELTIHDKDGNALDVHMYEAYWASLTEGKVTARDAMWFLFMAGLRGIQSSWGTGEFDRWMFDDWQEFNISHGKLLLVFAVALLTLAALLLMNIAIAAATVSASKWIDPPLARIASDLFGYEWRVVLCLGLGIGLPWVYRSIRSRAPRPAKTLPRWAGWISTLLMYLTLVLTIWTGLKIGFDIIAGNGALLATPLPGILKILARSGHEFGVVAGWLLGPFPRNAATHISPWFLLVTWALAITIAYGVRWFLRQFVGDVAAYVSSYSVSKFDELRKAIQKTALDVMQPVYQEETANSRETRRQEAIRGEPRSKKEYEYEEIVAVGHSLGSVITYDTLNTLINCPQPDDEPLDVPARTKFLLTFGSPLDKTAFIFRNQRPRSNEVREALAAAMQPMILSYGFRPARWVNIYSPADWISGSLEFYDPCRLAQQDPVKKVENLLDPEACIPLIAHTSYWTNDLFGEQLFRAVTS